ncbi:MAG TPA: sulfite exporter TauE/SafE family protein [Alcaligenaceae bacterium]|nr:sulfite exporter TauE/SafE family protein [Alcaligenaceae bacterium]
MSLLWMVPFGLVAGSAIGFIGAMMGIGGGMIAIPGFGLLLNMEQQLAQGTALILVLPAVSLSVRQYHLKSPIDTRLAIYGALGAVSSTWIGAHLALGLDPVLLRRSFAVFLFFLALFYVWQSLGYLSVRKRLGMDFGRWQALTLGALTGVLGGFFGVGGAILSVPILTALFGLSQTKAQGLALSMIIPGSTIALFTYALAGQVNWTVGISLAIGSMLTVPLGVKFAHHLPEKQLRLAFSVLLFATVPLLLLR